MADLDMREDNIRDVLNRSRRDRLTKAAKLGFGPWARLKEGRSRTSEEGEAAPSGAAASSAASSAAAPAKPQRPAQAVSEGSRPAPLLRQQVRQSTALRGSTEDEPDLNGFLAPKHPAKAGRKVQLQAAAQQASQERQPAEDSEPAPAPKLQPPVAQKEPAPKLELKISSKTSQRTVAANAGARPKAASRPIIDAATEELIQRQLEERAAEEFQAMQARARKTIEGFMPPPEEPEAGEASFRRRPNNEGEDEDSRSRSRSERRRRQKEAKKEKRKREEWRKTWKEERMRKGRAQSKSKSKTPEPEEAEEVSEREEAVEENIETLKSRALTWSMLNNHGVTTARDVQRKYVGQISDEALDKRIREAQVATQSERLMSEEEVLAKLQKKRKPNAGRGAATTDAPSARGDVYYATDRGAAKREVK